MQDFADLLRHSIDLEDRIKWLEKGLKEIANGRDDMNGIYIKQQAQATLDGEPTTADKYNDVISQYEDHEIQSEIKDTMQEDEKLVYEEDFGETRNAQQFSASPENVVRISDINKEIAKEWNRDREEKINKESN
jgi:hypothetical protein